MVTIDHTHPPCTQLVHLLDSSNSSFQQIFTLYLFCAILYAEDFTHTVSFNAYNTLKKILLLSLKKMRELKLNWSSINTFTNYPNLPISKGVPQTWDLQFFFFFFLPGQPQGSCPSLPGTGEFPGHGTFSATTGKVPCRLDELVSLPQSHAQGHTTGTH